MLLLLLYEVSIMAHTFSITSKLHLRHFRCILFITYHKSHALHTVLYLSESCAIILPRTVKYHELSRHVLHECCRHKCNTGLTMSDISLYMVKITCTCVASVVSMVMMLKGGENALCDNGV